MQTARTPNIAFRRQRLRNGIDSTPSKAESLERNWMGPFKRNLLVPKDEANRLTIKVTRGKAELKSGKFDNDWPNSSFG